MSRFATIEIHKEELKFSAGHFMIISDTERETLHGHDYQVQVTFQTEIKNNGMAFDCRIYKEKIQQLCRQLDYRFILPATSKHLRLEESDKHIKIYVNSEEITFLKRDVIALPICNVTLEELSHWFLQQLLANPEELASHSIQKITIKVFNGRGESGSTSI